MLLLRAALWRDFLLPARAAHKKRGNERDGNDENGQPESRVKEYELANLWGEAAGAFYGVDNNIAPLLLLKSQAWAAPTQWPEERVRELERQLEDSEARGTTALDQQTRAATVLSLQLGHLRTPVGLLAPPWPFLR